MIHITDINFIPAIFRDINKNLYYILTDKDEFQIFKENDDTLEVSIYNYYYDLLINPNINIIDSIIFFNKWLFVEKYNIALETIRQMIINNIVIPFEKLPKDIIDDLLNVDNIYLRKLISYIFNQQFIKKELAPFTFSMSILLNNIKNIVNVNNYLEYCGNIECFKYLISNGYKYDENTLINMAKFKSNDCLKYLSYVAPFNNIVYETAAYYNNLDCLKMTPKIHSVKTYINAALTGNLEILKYLYSRHTYVNLEILKACVDSDNTECLIFLLNKGCERHESLILLAVTNDKIKCLPILLDYINITDMYNLPLAAVKANNVTILKYLLSKGIAINNLAIDIAVKYDYDDCLYVINDYIDKNNLTTTYTDYAVQNCSFACLVLMLKNNYPHNKEYILSCKYPGYEHKMEYLKSLI